MSFFFFGLVLLHKLHRKRWLSRVSCKVCTELRGTTSCLPSPSADPRSRNPVFRIQTESRGSGRTSVVGRTPSGDAYFVTPTILPSTSSSVLGSTSGFGRRFIDEVKPVQLKRELRSYRVWLFPSPTWVTRDFQQTTKVNYKNILVGPLTLVDLTPFRPRNTVLRYRSLEGDLGDLSWGGGVCGKETSFSDGYSCINR